MEIEKLTLGILADCSKSELIDGNYSGTPASVNPYRALEPDLIVGYLTISICYMIFVERRPRNGRLAVPWTNSLGVRCWHAP